MSQGLLEGSAEEIDAVGRRSDSRLARHAARVTKALLGRQSLGAAIATIIAFVVFSLRAPYFDTLQSFATVLQLSAELGIVSVGVTLLMITGEYDLSIGSVAALSALLVAELSQRHVPLALTLLAVVAMAAGIGLLNGILVTVAGAPSLIVTLGGLFFWQAVVLMITKGYPADLVHYGTFASAFSATWKNFSIAIVWWAGAIAVFGFVLWRTALGNHIFATGGDRAAARNMGVAVRRVKILMFVITSVLAALMGMIELTRFASADSTIGQDMELTAIAATVIGGTTLTGGAGTIAGTTFGVLTLGMIEVGLQLANAQPYLFQGLVGVILLGAVLVNLYISRLARSRS